MELSYCQMDNNKIKIEDAIISIQRSFRNKRKKVCELNESLCFTYYCLLGVMKRLRDSFRYDILTI